jgi:hypothetical protein
MQLHHEHGRMAALYTRSATASSIFSRVWMVPFPLQEIVFSRRQSVLRRLLAGLLLRASGHGDTPTFRPCFPEPSVMPGVKVRSHHPDVPSQDIVPFSRSDVRWSIHGVGSVPRCVQKARLTKRPPCGSHRDPALSSCLQWSCTLIASSRFDGTVVSGGRLSPASFVPASPCPG